MSSLGPWHGCVVPLPVPDPVGLAAVLGGDLIALASYIGSRRAKSLEDFLRQLQLESGKSAEALIAVMEKEDLFSEIVERGIESAVRSASASKRQLLGRVVVSALSGTGFASPERHLLLIKTVDAIEPVHVQLLVLMACPTPGEGELAGTGWEGRWTEQDILRKWPELSGVVRPILAVLDREGLVDSSAQSTFGGTGIDNFAPSAWGRLLLTFLAEVELRGAQLGAAEITCRYQPEPNPVVIVRNLGPGRASNIRVTIPSSDGRSILGRQYNQSPTLVPFELDPLLEWELEVEIPTLSCHPPYDVHITWNDVRDEMRTVVMVNRDNR